MAVLSTYPDHTLAKLIEHWGFLEKQAEKDLVHARDSLRELQAELRRRELEAFWQENEGLRLEVGDKLLVTDEYNNLQPNGWNFTGEIHEIVSLKPIGNAELSITCEKAYLAAVPLPIARRMREAYLQAHGEAQP